MHPGKESNFSKKSNVYLEFTSHIQTHMNNPDMCQENRDNIS